MFDSMSRKRTERKFNKLYDKAISEKQRDITPKLFEEHSNGVGDDFHVVVGKSLFSKDRPSTRKVSKYLTERRRSQSVSLLNSTIMRSPYLYERIDTFYDRESYFSRSLIRQVETMMRNGYEFTSEDPRKLATTKQEFTRIQMDSGMPLNQFLFTMGMNLLKYGIAIVHKVRERVKDPVAVDDKRKSRVTRLRFVKPHTANFYVNNKGKIIGVWDGNSNYISQAIQGYLANNKQQKFNGILAEDLFIAYMSDPGDDIFPEPPCFQMLDDVLTLRSIEETVELLCFQYGSPLLHAKVGNDDYLPTPDEIDIVNDQLVNVAPNGMITTDHRVKIDVVNIQDGIANLIPFLEHFKNRVLMGSGSSPISIGEGDTANRNTAESIDDALADHCTYVANAICDPINHNLIPDLLVRSETPWSETDLFDVNGELNVRLEFNETRLEKQIARDNNVINLWEGNLLRFPEARRILKKGPLRRGEEKELYVNMVQIPLKEAGVKDPFADTSVKNKTTSQNQPTNQYGTKAGPGSRKD